MNLITPSKILNTLESFIVTYERKWFNSTTVILEKLFRCELNKLPEKVLRYKFMHLMSKRNHWYGKCLLNNPLKTCVQRLTDICRSSKIRAIKSVRIHRRDDILKYLLTRLPGLKIIHLVRDPRGIVPSRRRLEHFTSPIKHAASLCKDMELDICKNIPLFNSTPKRIHKVIYEEMAENPASTIRKVYEFLQEKPPEQMITSIVKKCSANAGSGAYGTSRTNSSKTAYAWRQTIPFELARFIDDHCGVIYRYGGYIRLQSDSQLKNSAYKTRNNGQQSFLPQMLTLKRHVHKGKHTYENGSSAA
ncbi:hypothetical protein ScPMuIL_003094 [Solemya velum]